MRREDGSFDNAAVVLIAPEPLVVMTSHSSVAVRDGAVCGKVQAVDLQEATFEITGQPASPEQTDKLRALVGKGWAPLLSQQICTTYEPAGALLTARATVDGKPRPELDMKVAWVSPADGYKVAP